MRRCVLIVIEVGQILPYVLILTFLLQNRCVFASDYYRRVLSGVRLELLDRFRELVSIELLHVVVDRIRLVVDTV